MSTGRSPTITTLTCCATSPRRALRTRARSDGRLAEPWRFDISEEPPAGRDDGDEVDAARGLDRLGNRRAPAAGAAAAAAPPHPRTHSKTYAEIARPWLK